MTPHPAPTTLQRVRHELAKALNAGVAADVAGPVRAGMRARAVADACAALDLAAVLIDATGRVLHVNDHAQSWIRDGRVGLRAEHVIGANRSGNDAIGRAIAEAVGDSQGASPSQDGALTVTGLAFRDSSPYQLLRGILVFGLPRSHGAIQALQDALCTTASVKAQGHHRQGLLRLDALRGGR